MLRVFAISLYVCALISPPIMIPLLISIDIFRCNYYDIRYMRCTNDMHGVVVREQYSMS